MNHGLIAGMLSSQSIGIIGGADGPTAIFVTGTPVRLILGIGLVVLGVAGAILFEKRKK